MSLAEALPELLLGTLEGPEAEALEALLAADPGLSAERDALADALAEVALSMPPVAPSREARARLLAAVEGPERFAPFVDRLSLLFDLGRARIRELLAATFDPAQWSGGPCAGVQLMHFAAGPAAHAYDAGFVRLAAGVEFPEHLHTGREVAIVIEGAYVELETGVVVRAGEVARRDAGSKHTFRALEDLTFAVVLEGGIEIGGVPYGG